MPSTENTPLLDEKESCEHYSAALPPPEPRVVEEAWPNPGRRRHCHRNRRERRDEIAAPLCNVKVIGYVTCMLILVFLTALSMIRNAVQEEEHKQHDFQASSMHVPGVEPEGKTKHLFRACSDWQSKHPVLMWLLASVVVTLWIWGLATEMRRLKRERKLGGGPRIHPSPFHSSMTIDRLMTPGGT